MSSIYTSPALRDLGLRILACFLAFSYPLVYLWLYRGQPVPAAALVVPALGFLVVALCAAVAAGGKNSPRRAIVFTLVICYFLDFQTGWFNGAYAAIAALAIAGLCWLLREHMLQILTVMFAAIFLSSLLIDPAQQYREQVVEYTDSTGSAPRADDVIIHLILDEFIGLDGIPADIAGGIELRKELEDFFLDYGMTVYGGAFSQYVSTRASISSMLNFEASATPSRNYRGKNPYVLLNNAYFKNLALRGYDIHVYQSTYLDYCRQSPVRITSCLTFRYDGTDWLRDAGLSDEDKLAVLLGIYLNHPGAMEWFWKSHTQLRSLAGRLELPLPAIMTWDGRVSSLASVAALQRLHRDLEQAAPGDAYFAHLLLPHSPYALHEHCALRGAPLQWRNHHPLQQKHSTAAGREIRYRQYFEQVRCTVAMLEPLLDSLKQRGLWERTQVIMHGDHGSRIFTTAPKAANVNKLTPADISDGFSTLFAVKSGNGGGVVVDDRTPAAALLAAATGSTFGNPTDGTDGAAIYLEVGGERPWQQIPYPDGDGASQISGEASASPTPLPGQALPAANNTDR